MLAWLVAAWLYIECLCRVTMATDLILLKPGCACDLFGKQQMKGDGSFWATEALPPVEFSLGVGSRDLLFLLATTSKPEHFGVSPVSVAATVGGTGEKTPMRRTGSQSVLVSQAWRESFPFLRSAVDPLGLRTLWTAAAILEQSFSSQVERLSRHNSAGLRCAQHHLGGSRSLPSTRAPELA